MRDVTILLKVNTGKCIDPRRFGQLEHIACDCRIYTDALQHCLRSTTLARGVARLDRTAHKALFDKGMWLTRPAGTKRARTRGGQILRMACPLQ
jgi:hypothetical protein